MAPLEQQSPQECVTQGFDLLEEKDNGFPVFDEALKQKLLDGAKKGFEDAGMSQEQIDMTIGEWFPESSKNNPFFQRESNREDIRNFFQKFSEYYKGVDLDVATNAIQEVYDRYKEGFDIYIQEYETIKNDAHEGIFDCHLDAEGNILEDYSERIRSYAKDNGIPKDIIDKFIHTLGKTKGEVERGEHIKYGVDVMDIGFELPITQLDEEHYRYLSGLGTAVLIVSADKYKKNSNK